MKRFFERGDESRIRIWITIRKDGAIMLMHTPPTPDP